MSVTAAKIKGGPKVCNPDQAILRSTCIVAAISLLATFGCPDAARRFSISASAQELAEQVFEIGISNGKVAEDNQLIRVKSGDSVVLRWTADAPTEVHLHGYDIELEIEPGTEAVMTFTAEIMGRFPVEAHGDEGHAPLLYVEVYPR